MVSMMISFKLVSNLFGKPADSPPHAAIAATTAVGAATVAAVHRAPAIPVENESPGDSAWSETAPAPAPDAFQDLAADGDAFGGTVYLK